MKNRIFIVTACVALCLLAGCKKKGSDKEPDSFYGSASAPSWSVSDSYDYSSSMTAIIAVDLGAQYPDKASDFVLSSDDVVAAFIQGVCVGVACFSCTLPEERRAMSRSAIIHRSTSGSLVPTMPSRSKTTQ